MKSERFYCFVVDERIITDYQNPHTYRVLGDAKRRTMTPGASFFYEIDGNLFLHKIFKIAFGIISASIKGFFLPIYGNVTSVKDTYSLQSL